MEKLDQNIMKTILLHPTEHDVGMRLDHFVAAQAAAENRTRAQGLIRSGAVLLNNHPSTKSNKTVKNGDIITVLVDEAAARYVKIDNYADFFKKQLIAEYEDFLVLNKPAGINVHPPRPQSAEAAVSDLMVAYHPSVAALGDADRPGVVHRLDKFTSGVLLVAKTQRGYDGLRQLFAERCITKKYLAVAAGRPPATGTVQSQLRRDPIAYCRMMCVDAGGRDACTHYRVLQYYAAAALLEVHPITGRMHQIRVHLAHEGFYIIGDPLYGKKDARIAGQALHARSISFTFMGQEFYFEAPMPPEFEALLGTLETA
ncbi:MAG: RluA family pseudouridine synthase [Candidatus Dependentiae bacterium]|nr:RluA family pseudouridine synthase [Candidatus Dependentiae bacterium]